MRRDVPRIAVDADAQGGARAQRARHFFARLVAAWRERLRARVMFATSTRATSTAGAGAARAAIGGGVRGVEGNHLRRGGRVGRGHTRGALVIRAAVRPYTIRKGDTLETIASKRKMSVSEVRKYNKKLGEGATLAPGTTILLPAEKLSSRDQAIIDGIDKINEPRVYPTRAGETIEDIIAPRKISRADVERLNPGVKLGALKAGVKLKLPPGKYTVREKEMLQGCGILPAETLNPLAVLGTPLALKTLGAVAALGAYAMYFAACRRYQTHGTKLWGNDLPEIDDD